MTIVVFLLVAVFLLALNAFFVLAEFASVKTRPSRTEELISQGDPRAPVVKHVQDHLDEYLSVCQVGITFASIGLGFVGEPAFADLIMRAWGVDTTTAHTVAVTAGYIIVSSLHIVFGELLPKSLAIRKPERSALLTARPLRLFRRLFWLPLKVLNGVTIGILRLFGMSRQVEEPEHSEEELRIILADTQETGGLSFERLLLLENIFDLRELRVRDVMRPRSAVRALRIDAPWPENQQIIRESRFSRFPLLDAGHDLPVGVVHVKDLYYEGTDPPDLTKLARPCLTTPESTRLESLLSDLRRHRGHLVLVKNEEGKWTGALSLEDVLEELVGSIEDEFETEPRTFVSDALSPERVVLGVEGSSLEEAIGQTFGKLGDLGLPVPKDVAVKAVLERERAMSTYLGGELAIPHARLEGLDRPVLFFARSQEGIPVRGRSEKARLLFILLTPAGSPRAQVRLLARIAGLVQSEYVNDRLRTAGRVEDVVEAIRAAEAIAV
ncbi:MAG TPA: CNNM domain-containing protein [Planctomycetota bacterium]